MQHRVITCTPVKGWPEHGNSVCRLRIHRVLHVHVYTVAVIDHLNIVCTNIYVHEETLLLVNMISLLALFPGFLSSSVHTCMCACDICGGGSKEHIVALPPLHLPALPPSFSNNPWLYYTYFFQSKHNKRLKTWRGDLWTRKSVCLCMLGPCVSHC